MERTLCGVVSEAPGRVHLARVREAQEKTGRNV